MFYRDPLYGTWKLPEPIEKLIHTHAMTRIRNISQSVLPNSLSPYPRTPSRFEHCLGTCRLAYEVTTHNPHLPEKMRKELLIAALYHDAGNPPLSHLGEHFLEAVLHKNGESFLEDMLLHSESSRIMRQYDVIPDRITRWVCGNIWPQSTVLNGSLDIDNLDNVGRFNHANDIGAESFDALRIASSFRYQNGWILPDDCFDEVQKWKRARATVYNAIYSEPFLAAATMVYRAVELAFQSGKIKRRFFFYDDNDAITYLWSACGEETETLIEKAMRWEWYKTAVVVETATPNVEMRQKLNSWQYRTKLANLICKKLGMRKEKVCVYAGIGRDKKEITVPFIGSHGVRFDKETGRNFKPQYRIKVYVSPELMEEQKRISQIVLSELQ